MRTLSEREKRTIRIGAVLVAGYLAIFYGSKGVRILEEKLAAYRSRVQEADDLKVAVLRETNKGVALRKLRESLRVRPEELREETVVGDASAAIGKAAQAAGIQLGPTKETRASAARAMEIASIGIEGQGSISSAIGFIHGLREIGFPIMMDSVQLKASPGGVGQVAISMNIVVLNYAAWQPPEKSRA
jgi:hypothetical protein